MHVYVFIYIYKIIIHSPPTYITYTQTFILDVINRDYSFDSPIPFREHPFFLLGDNSLYFSCTLIFKTLVDLLAILHIA